MLGLRWDRPSLGGLCADGFSKTEMGVHSVLTDEALSVLMDGVDSLPDVLCCTPMEVERALGLVVLMVLMVLVLRLRDANTLFHPLSLCSDAPLHHHHHEDDGYILMS
ncbi:unnamed protein product [Lota lota]